MTTTTYTGKAESEAEPMFFGIANGRYGLPEPEVGHA